MSATDQYLRDGDAVDLIEGKAVDHGGSGAVDLSDSEAVELCLAGNTSAFEPLVKRYEQPVFGFLYALTSDVEGSRLFAIARNLLRDSWRCSRRTPRSIEPAVGENILTDPGPAPDAGIEKEDCRRLLGEALALLPAREREVVILKDIQERSYTDIAQILGIPVGTVASRVYHARRHLIELASLAAAS